MSSLTTNSTGLNICSTCGTRHASAKAPSGTCAICLDERQFVGDQGQSWTSLQQLAAQHTIRFSNIDEHLLELRMVPAFAITQKAHIVLSPSGNVLWDCIPLINDEAIAYIRSIGGLKAIAISHPHFYSLMIEWAKVFDCPVYLHAADRQWVMDDSERIHFWEGGEMELWDGIRIIHAAGHFDGSAVLHIPAGKGTLLTGDTIYVSRDRKQVSAMYSYPNMIPLGAKAIRYIVEQLEPLSFDRLYAAFEWMNIHEGARGIVGRSFKKYLDIVSGQSS
jgi:hypothetical protein